MLMCSAKLSSITSEIGDSVKLPTIFLDSGGMVFRPIKKRGFPLLYQYVYYRNAVLATKPTLADSGWLEASPASPLGYWHLMGSLVQRTSGRLRREDSIRWGRPELR